MSVKIRYFLLVLMVVVAACAVAAVPRKRKAKPNGQPQALPHDEIFKRVKCVDCSTRRRGVDNGFGSDTKLYIEIVLSLVLLCADASTLCHPDCVIGQRLKSATRDGFIEKSVQRGGMEMIVGLCADMVRPTDVVR